MMPAPSDPAAPPLDTLALIEQSFAPISGRDILDIGCGTGVLARSLAKLGAVVTGIDPSSEALVRARETAPAATFHEAPAQALPFASETFDGAVFLNALHHVPEPAMADALREALRVTRPGGAVVIVEPLAQGSYFAAMLPVEDETRIRAAAQGAIARGVDAGLGFLERAVDYVRRERFADLESFVARLVAAEPARAPVAGAKRHDLEAAFAAQARRDPDGRFVLEQPMRAHIVRRAPSPRSGKGAGHGS